MLMLIGFAMVIPPLRPQPFGLMPAHMSLHMVGGFKCQYIDSDKVRVYTHVCIYIYTHTHCRFTVYLHIYIYIIMYNVHMYISI